MASEQNPDLILLDVMMGKVDEGFQVAYQLRSDEATAETPILMLTAVTDQTGFDFDPGQGQGFPAGERVPGKTRQSAQAGGHGAQASADERVRSRPAEIRVNRIDARIVPVRLGGFVAPAAGLVQQAALGRGALGVLAVVLIAGVVSEARHRRCAACC